MRITRGENQRMVDRLQKAGANITLTSAYNLFKVETKDESRALSLRGSTREINFWLRGYESAWNDIHWLNTVTPKENV